MSFLNDLYQKSLAGNETNIRFWEDYLNNLKSLDFNVYANKLNVPALIPIGSRIYFRGEIKHTNEVTVSLGADYFAKCSIQQAEVLKQHRIKDAEQKLNMYLKEKEYLERQLSFNKSDLENQGQEIIEYYSEEDDKAWRVKHRENVRKYKQGKSKEEGENGQGISDEELWNRLEELELEEELDNELNSDSKEKDIKYKSKDSFVVDEASLFLNTKKNKNTIEHNTISSTDDNTKDKITEINDTEETQIPISKIDLLQQIVEKQDELESKLTELKHRKKPKSKTESDLIAKLDEMDELDELEDEIDRLDEMLLTRGYTDEIEEDSTEKTKTVKLKKSITFADEDDSETLELTFKHSEVEPNEEPYNPERGITKPSDLYAAYSNLFDSKTNSILSKKSKYADNNINIAESDYKLKKKISFKPQLEMAYEEDEDNLSDRTIVIKDVIEKPAVEEKKFDVSVRPTSLFKKKRMQQAKNSSE